MFVVALELTLTVPEEGLAVSHAVLPVDADQFKLWVQAPLALSVAG